ncbi:MAG TPA: 4Fe-4S cluster-binding domain-containing protein [Caldithrix abyssi]|uniref:4Fe-4S cluster-binding domain-containing protein n=1 Tax=Caldithrix abyssi TaxID=187145 RepID=A0A7V4UDR5_CALAY|nr:4Fe-4S cluster-binding domain-containing protein [Caldithrix abyssi]
MFYNLTRFLNSPYSDKLPPQVHNELQHLVKVFPFKVSRYVLDELIDWDNFKEDPIYRLVFPSKDMLSEEHWQLLKSAKSTMEEKEVITKIRRQLNPHPANQKHNIPRIGDRVFGGIQHKYVETVLFFPAQGQTCHSYCTYCFRWAQFVNLDEHKFKSKDHKDLFDYLKHFKTVTDILFTGGDPMFMNNATLFSYLDIICKPELDHVNNIRIGSKALAFYPDRFLGEEGDAFLNGIDKIIRKGKNVTLMAHFSHPRELSTDKVKEAIRRLRDAGVVIRTQAPLIRGINDSAEIWSDMWKQSVQLGMIPYYMFVERDTGAHEYFSVPLARAYRIFTEAYSQVSGLAKTVRGPSMSASPGKVLISGITRVAGEKKFILKFIQARNPELINKPFFASFDEEAIWLTDLEIDSPMKEKLENQPVDFEEDEMKIDEVA